MDEKLTKLEEVGVMLILKNWGFFSDSVDFPGHLIESSRLKIYHTRTNFLKGRIPQTNRSALKSFLGLYNIYLYPRFHVYRTHAQQTLTQRRLENFELDGEQIKSFHGFIKKIYSMLVIPLPRFGLPCSVDTDASA